MDPLGLQAAQASIKGTLEWTASNILIDVESFLSQDQTAFDLASEVEVAEMLLRQMCLCINVISFHKNFSKVLLMKNKARKE